MSRLILACILCSVFLLGCADADINAKTDVKTDIKSEIETFMKVHLESLIKAQIDTKVQGVGVDIKNKLADEIKADIKSELQTDIKALISANTQNVGMFSGGAIYVVILAIVFLALLLGTFIWLIKALMKWKNIWHLLSQSIEEHSKDEIHGNHIKKVKSHFSQAIEAAGLKKIVDKNLKKRGLLGTIKS